MLFARISEYLSSVTYFIDLYVFVITSESLTLIIEALKGMEKVAEHINEMQRIHEEYGAIFDHLFRQHQKSCKQVSKREEKTGVHEYLFCLFYILHFMLILRFASRST